MSNPGNQNSQKSASKQKPGPVPESLQGTEDTQSEFVVNAMREERREEENKADEQASNTASSNESNAAETQSEFSINERLRGKT
jgi:hypothetical protein